jgi:pyruvate-ferredoxin/flavodoxin oxidoreductase
MTYGNVYVARVAFGAKDAQTVKAFQEAEAYRAVAHHRLQHCIAHGYDLAQGLEPAEAGGRDRLLAALPLRPAAHAEGESPLKLDSAAPKGGSGPTSRNETRFRMVEQQDPERFKMLADEAQADVHTRWASTRNGSRGDDAAAETPARPPERST